MIDSPYLPYAFALLLALPFLIFVRQFVFSYIKLKNQEIKLLTVKGNSAQRVHAYERLTLFLERMKPANTLHLIHKTYENLGEQATLEDFKTVFLMNYMNEEDYISQTIEDLRRENLIVN